jgi:adenylyltransferase/sulfurtransferase
MTKFLSTEEAMRYSRQISLQGFDLEKQEILLNSKVLIIGAGGLGCAAAQYLVAAGVGALTIVDDDIVELSNIQRQVLHVEANIGKKKVSSAKSSLEQINNSVQLNTIDHRLDNESLAAAIEQHCLVIDCTDNLQSRDDINQLCYMQKTDLVSGAAIRMEGQIFCVSPKLNSACYACLSQFFGEQELSCVESGVMSPVVGVIGAYQALEAIKLLTSYGKVNINQLQIFDAMESQWQSFGVKQNSQCPVCSVKRDE